MPSNKNMKDLLAKKAPSMLRQAVTPVDIIEAATRKPDQERRTDQATQKPDDKPDEQSVSTLPNERYDEVSSSIISVGNSEEIRRGDKPLEKANEVIPSANSMSKPDEQSQVKDPIHTPVAKKRSDQSSDKPERKTRAKKPKMYSERDIEALLAVDKREIVRYSFEAYADQKDDIQKVCDLYKERTGHYLSASRLMREVLDSFLPGAIKAFEDSER